MSYEMLALALTTLILFALLIYQGALVPIHQGFSWGLGSRDEPTDSTVLQRRVARTVANHIEGMLLFIPLAVIIELSDLTADLSVLGAALYIVGRVAFAPLYILGVPYLRSVVWGASVAGLLMMAWVITQAIGTT